MKKVFLILSLFLFGTIQIISAQNVAPNEDFAPRATDLWQKIKQANTDKNNVAIEQYWAEYQKLFEEQPEDYRKNNVNTQVNIYYNLACAQSLQNKVDAAVKNFELAVQNGYSNYRHILEDSDLDNIRDNAIYQKIVTELSDKYDYLKILKQTQGYTPNQHTDTLPHFTYANTNDSNLIRVRQYFNLDSVAGKGDEISQIKNILTFIHNKIQHDGNHENPKSSDAIGLAEACKDGSRGLNCRGLATVLNECYLSMGFPSRFITCMPKVYISDCHVINAVYSKTLHKWLYIDPTQNAWVMDENGTLLSIQEVREGLRDGRPLVLNEEANWNNKEKAVKEEYLENYMSKNLFYLESLFDNGFNAEGKKFDAKNYAILLPTGYTNKMTDGSYVVNDDAWFWQAPSE